MCLLVCIRRADGSLAVAANRDERYDRPTRQPFLWQLRPAILAGRDEAAGGTWLAVSERGLVAAVTNRPTAGGQDASRPSRGHLPLLACRSGSAGDARAALAGHLASTRYNGFNLLVADAAEAFVVQSPGGQAEVQDVVPGVHVVANGAWNDRSDRRVARARELLEGWGITADSGQPEIIAALTELCRDHEGAAGTASLCAHGEHAGTVSSTVLLLGPEGTLNCYLHAAGPPCQSEYRELAATLRQGPR